MGQSMVHLSSRYAIQLCSAPRLRARARAQRRGRGRGRSGAARRAQRRLGGRARRTAQALHPTNLHVNEALFPRDTIQSRLPNPEWLEQWLDTQIQFDAVWENKVVERILHNLSLLMERSFASVQELNRFRKEMLAALAAKTPAQPAPSAG